MIDLNIERRPIPNFPGYHATVEGDIISRRQPTPCQLLPQCRKGVLRVTVRDASGHAECKQVHHLVLTAYYGPRPSPRHVGRHIDGDKANNQPSNLEWVTLREARAKFVRRGEQAGGAKLTNAQVVEIAHRLRAGEGFESIARDYDVVPQTIDAIKRGKSWSHLTDPIFFPQQEAA